MELQEALSRALQDMSAPTRVTEIVDMFGAHGLRDVAKELVGMGVMKPYAGNKPGMHPWSNAQRNLERYIKSEAGGEGQARHPSKKTWLGLTTIAKREQMRRDGVTVGFDGVIDYDGNPDYRRYRTGVSRPVDGAHLGNWLNALKPGNVAAEAFQADFMAAYNLPGSTLTALDRLVLVPGA